MIDSVAEAVNLIQHGNKAFFKFIAANETGDTGGHQYGFYIPRDFLSEAFETPCEKGTNQDKRVRIVWNGEDITESRFVYYGRLTRDEARITQFGKRFEYLKSEYTGAVVVFVKENEQLFHSFVFNSEEEIDAFFSGLGLGPTDANRLIRIDGTSGSQTEDDAFRDYIRGLKVDFPSSVEMSTVARQIAEDIYDHTDYVTKHPDEKLLSWTGVEFRLFRTIENNRLNKLVTNGFPTVDDFLSVANQVLNRRKSRAGKSLEHQLAAVFTGNHLEFEEQVRTEGRKKPDFIFPSSQAYHDSTFPLEKLIFLAAKTTCKDRWRQILVEAERFKDRVKFLCTLQQGMSEDQIKDMVSEHVQLVVPQPYVKYYPKTWQSKILTVEGFIGIVKQCQEK